ncbi:riboflavin synthase domain-like protein [Xylariomycetidae sp. FL2044]|nr:riboflavin synthase domain-like protein [Xylariomycetidae sp. FL2044]
MTSDQTDVVNSHDAQLDERRLLILYGSETGNSEDLAGDVERLAERLRFQTWVYEMNDIDLSSLVQYPLVIFILSTTGQGELPKNSLSFWKSLLRKRLPPRCLANLNFTTFGLGDSSYSKYNWAVRKLHKRLEQLGATEFFPRGEADEQHDDGIDGTFLPWSLSLGTHLLKEYPLPQGIAPIPPDVQLPPKYTIQLVPTMETSDIPMPDQDPPVPGEQVITGSATAHSDRSGARTTGQEQSQTFEPTHDRIAAAFSHVDVQNPERLQYELEIERMSPNSNAAAARLSEGTAKEYLGGRIDVLDRPNVLRDDPTKYTLQDTDVSEDDVPPELLLPIPDVWTGYVEDNQRITPQDHWQDVRHLILSFLPRPDPIDGHLSTLGYEPGDVAVIYPKNFPRDVQTLIDLMGWQDVADKPFMHKSRDDKAFPPRLPRNCYPVRDSTLRQLLLNNYDINAIPKRIFFEQVAFHTHDDTHRERLREFANPALSDEFYDYTSRPRRSILEVLHDFPSVKIPYEHIPSVFPVIRGREYSIASGGRLVKDPDDPSMSRVDLVIALIKYKTVLRKTRQGLCSRYVASLEPGTKINVTVRNRSIMVNDAMSSPLIAVAPGTGVAPVRALALDRDLVRQRGDLLLFFGGRNRKADFHFESQWKSLGVKVITAFSRDQEKKIYVQDRIRENAKYVCQLLRQGAIIVICGSAGKMPIAVRQAFCDAMVIGGLAPDAATAERYLKSNHHIWEEVW